jgi:hypothetical protein
MALTKTEEGENAYKSLDRKLSGRFRLGDPGVDVRIKFKRLTIILINKSHFGTYGS